MIDLTPRLYAFLGGMAMPKANGVQLEAAAKSSQNLEPSDASPTANKEEPLKITDGSDLKPSQPDEVKTDVSTHLISDVDLRLAIKECRERIMDGKTDPLLKKQINSLLREEVSRLGYDSSTKLPQELRLMFIEFCQNLKVDTHDDIPF